MNNNHLLESLRCLPFSGLLCEQGGNYLKFSPVAFKRDFGIFKQNQLYDWVKLNLDSGSPMLKAYSKETNCIYQQPIRLFSPTLPELVEEAAVYTLLAALDFVRHNLSHFNDFNSDDAGRHRYVQDINEAEQLIRLVFPGSQPDSRLEELQSKFDASLKKMSERYSHTMKRLANDTALSLSNDVIDSPLSPSYLPTGFTWDEESAGAAFDREVEKLMNETALADARERFEKAMNEDEKFREQMSVPLPEDKDVSEIQTVLDREKSKPSIRIKINTTDGQTHRLLMSVNDLEQFQEAYKEGGMYIYTSDSIIMHFLHTENITFTFVE